jgi:carbamoyl-phosphate synthase small subunit
MVALSALVDGSCNALLTLADGTVFPGYSIGADQEACAEIVFHTAMTGYEEVLSDPSYAQQFIVFTYPHIGNTGINTDDMESDAMHAAGIIISQKPTIASNWRCNQTLEDYLANQNKPAIYGVDTRALTAHIREHGSMGACLQTGTCVDGDTAQDKAKAFGTLSGMNLAEVVSTKAPYSFDAPTLSFTQQTNIEANHENQPHIVVMDFGVKKNILRSLVNAGARVTVLPYSSNIHDITEQHPDGILLSNGPGDPHACTHAIELTKQLLKKNIPIFGICLGHQILALASGAQTMVMPLGHHGANHPVLDIETGLVDVTSQNHNFAVDENSLPDCLTVTHRSLFDQSIQGVAHKHRTAFGMQGHPEACPGPKEHTRLFKTFIDKVMQHA